MWGGIEGFLKGRSQFVFVGCGSSYSLAKSFAVICNMGAGIPALAMAAGDILLHAQRYKKAIDGAAVVFISRSGRTSEAIQALEAIRSQGCAISAASLVCADDTPLGTKSDFVLCTPWAFDESVCQTRCVTNFYFMAVYICARMTGDTKALGDLQAILSGGLDYLSKAEALAQELSALPWNHAVVLADAELEGLAEEGALAFKEICQLPSSYHHMLDVRHGPMVLIGKETLVLAALGANNGLEHKLLQDAKQKGATVAAFSDTPVELQDIHAGSFGQPLSHAVRGIPFILLCQLIAYQKSKATGADPDKPDGLDPWIAL
jgi:fructoselysine-6-P-deglycase FrlB-like protein